MKALASFASLAQSVVLCGFGLGWSLCYGEVSRSELPCTIPSGLYNVHHLGAGHDSLTLSVTGYGEVHGSYQLQASAQGGHHPPLYEVWFNERTSFIRCHGDAVDIVTLWGFPAVRVTLVWNRELARLDAVGVYGEMAHWSRRVLHGAQILATLGALLQVGIYLEKHSQDFTTWYQDRIASYLLHEGFWGFSVPVVGFVAGSLSLPFMKFIKRSLLTASGGRVLAAKKNTTCDIPSGVYHGSITVPGQGIFNISAPVGDSKFGVLPRIVLTTDKAASAYDIIPSTYSCLGNEVVLEWKESDPPSRGYITAYYQEGHGLTAIGHFADTSWGRSFRSTVFPIFHLGKKSRAMEPFH